MGPRRQPLLAPLLSVAFHAAAVAGLVLVASRRPGVAPVAADRIEVLLAPVQPPPVSAKRRATPPHRGWSLGGAHRGFRGEVFGTRVKPAGRDLAEGRAEDVFRTMPPEREAATHPALRALHARIDESLVYPSELFENGIHGTVEIELEVGRRGALTARGARVKHSENPYLAVYVRRLVERRLREPLVGSVALPEERQRLLAHFEFAVVGHERELPSPGARALRNSLRFRRHRLKPRFFVQLYSDPRTGENATVLDVVGFVSWVGGLFSGGERASDPRLARYRDDPDF